MRNCANKICFCTGECEMTPEQIEWRRKARQEFLDMQKRANERMNDLLRKAQLCPHCGNKQKHA